MTARYLLRSKPWAGAAVKVLALVGVLGVKYVSCDPTELDCRHASREGNDGLAVIVCEREYARTQDPAIGVTLANALRRSGKRQAAAALANNLTATAARSDALQVLGKIDLSENRVADARRKLEAAHALHATEGRPDQLALDDQALAGIFRGQKQYAEALRALDACITEARAATDRLVEGYCHLSAGAVLDEIGYFEGASKELDLAEPLLVMSRDLAALDIARGGLDQRYVFGPLHQSRNAQAKIDFEHAIRHASAAALPLVTLQAELNLVYSLAELGHLDEAAAHLETARVLDLDDSGASDRALLEARIAYRRADFALATSINTRWYDKIADDDDRLRVCMMQAQIGLATGDLESTIQWATRGVQVVENMHGAQSALELLPWMLSMRRQPHELLFTALARARRFDDALAVFDQWQGRTLLDAMARARSAQPPSLRAAAMQTEMLHHLFPVLSNAPSMKPSDRATRVAALRRIDLVALLIANGELWRITARHGHLDMVDLGEIAALQPSLDAFEATPTKAELGDVLGEKLLGGDAFRDTGETLFVLLDGPTASLPVAALRARGRVLVAMRPMVRAARLSELGCVPAVPGPRHAVVLADPRGDLPDARREADKVATSFGVTAAIGAAATRVALFAASGNDVLHVAMHASVELGGGSLEMYDQPISALELATRRGGPGLVVLAACASAAANDGELATSLATAFLASGSTQVIATLHSVTDTGAGEITSKFYRAGGVTDPARALAHIQAELAQTDNVDWPHFVLFGHDTCRKETP
jgi:tetratricopeptide (TPR) repeat protein